MGGDFSIVDKANATSNNRIGYQEYYINKKYGNNRESFLRLNGS
jgi:hypothetical protein